MNKFVLVSILALGLLACKSYAAPVTPETVLLAKQALPLAAGTVNDVASISKLLPYILRLPRGVVKTGLAPLPGITMKGGLRDISTGLLATTKMAKETIRLPFKALSRVGGISPLAIAGL